MVGYQSKKFLAESREPDVPDVSYHYRETSDMIMEKANSDLFYNLRHLKVFRERTESSKTKWFCSWDGTDIQIIQIYDKNDKLVCRLDDIVMAEYICSLHNMSDRMIKEVESKYE
jgi:hypothetical protein